MGQPTRAMCANAIRALSMDSVGKANSGHPGMPMGMADIAQVLWQDFLNHNPKNPTWANRDRFILSNGHGAMLQYSLLHLSGYDVTMDDLKHFRQLHSKTPGHPEYGDTPGIETTTGPLGQGIANAVGMALAEKLLAETYNRPNFDIVDHHTYVFLGDGCLMEGISHEACSLAGTLGLSKLIAFYDDNGISIDGPVGTWFSDDTPKRFEAYGWHVISKVDGHNPEQIKAAIEQAISEKNRPTLICCKTVIGFGAPTLAGTEHVHGAPLGEKEIQGAREKLGWPYPPFEIPASIMEAWSAVKKGHHLESTWDQLFKTYEKQYPDLAHEFQRRMSGELPPELLKQSASWVKETQESGKEMATRKASLLTLSKIGPLCPELIGGSADLTGSNLTAWEGSTPFVPGKAGGNYIHYGVREFAMAGIMNGLSLHGGFIPYGGTFLTFLDYARNAVRLSALMKQRVIYVFSHDSIGLGEDGPTHQPIEHITMLRATPNMHTWRPADDVETFVAWLSALKHKHGPTSLLLTRQNVPHFSRTPDMLLDLEKGGYILADSAKPCDVILIATGSEVSLCMEAYEKLTSLGVSVRVVSMPCMELFKRQDTIYQSKVLPPSVKNRIAVEAGHPMPWYRWVGDKGIVMGIETFGASAPAKDVYRFVGLTVEKIIENAKKLITN